MYENEDLQMTSISLLGKEIFRFCKVFESAVQKLDINEQPRYLSQYSWFQKKATQAFLAFDINIVNLQGVQYDPGMAVTPLNLEEFDQQDKLLIDQMIEPIIMKGNRVLQEGTVLLGRTQ